MSPPTPPPPSTPSTRDRPTRYNLRNRPPTPEPRALRSATHTASPVMPPSSHAISPPPPPQTPRRKSVRRATQDLRPAKPLRTPTTASRRGTTRRRTEGVGGVKDLKSGNTRASSESPMKKVGTRETPHVIVGVTPRRTSTRLREKPESRVGEGLALSAEVVGEEDGVESESVSKVTLTPRTLDNLDMWRKAELVVECRRRRLKIAGTKKELRRRIRTSLQAEPVLPPSFEGEEIMVQQEIEHLPEVAGKGTARPSRKGRVRKSFVEVDTRGKHGLVRGDEGLEEHRSDAKGPSTQRAENETLNLGSTGTNYGEETRSMRDSNQQSHVAWYRGEPKEEDVKIGKSVESAEFVDADVRFVSALEGVISGEEAGVRHEVAEDITGRAEPDRNGADKGVTPIQAKLMLPFEERPADAKLVLPFAESRIDEQSGESEKENIVVHTNEEEETNDAVTGVGIGNIEGMDLNEGDESRREDGVPSTDEEFDRKVEEERGGIEADHKIAEGAVDAGSGEVVFLFGESAEQSRQARFRVQEQKPVSGNGRETSDEGGGIVETAADSKFSSRAGLEIQENPKSGKGDREVVKGENLEGNSSEEMKTEVKQTDCNAPRAGERRISNESGGDEERDDKAMKAEALNDTPEPFPFEASVVAEEATGETNGIVATLVQSTDALGMEVEKENEDCTDNLNEASKLQDGERNMSFGDLDIVERSAERHTSSEHKELVRGLETGAKEYDGIVPNVVQSTNALGMKVEKENEDCTDNVREAREVQDVERNMIFGNSNAGKWSVDRHISIEHKEQARTLETGVKNFVSSFADAPCKSSDRYMPDTQLADYQKVTDVDISSSPLLPKSNKILTREMIQAEALSGSVQPGAQKVSNISDATMARATAAAVNEEGSSGGECVDEYSSGQRSNRPGNISYDSVPVAKSVFDGEIREPVHIQSRRNVGNVQEDQLEKLLNQDNISNQMKPENAVCDSDNVDDKTQDGDAEQTVENNGQQEGLDDKPKTVDLPAQENIYKSPQEPGSSPFSRLRKKAKNLFDARPQDSQAVTVEDFVRDCTTKSDSDKKDFPNLLKLNGKTVSVSGPEKEQKMVSLEHASAEKSTLIEDNGYFSESPLPSPRSSGQQREDGKGETMFPLQDGFPHSNTRPDCTVETDLGGTPGTHVLEPPRSEIQAMNSPVGLDAVMEVSPPTLERGEVENVEDQISIMADASNADATVQLHVSSPELQEPDDSISADNDVDSSAHPDSLPVDLDTPNINEIGTSEDGRSSDDGNNIDLNDQGSANIGDPADEIGNLASSDSGSERSGDSRSSQGSQSVVVQTQDDQRSSRGSLDSEDISASSPRSGASSESQAQEVELFNGGLRDGVARITPPVETVVISSQNESSNAAAESEPEHGDGSESQAQVVAADVLEGDEDAIMDGKTDTRAEGKHSPTGGGVCAALDVTVEKTQLGLPTHGKESSRRIHIQGSDDCGGVGAELDLVFEKTGEAELDLQTYGHDSSGGNHIRTNDDSKDQPTPSDRQRHGQPSESIPIDHVVMASVTGSPPNGVGAGQKSTMQEKKQGESDDAAAVLFSTHVALSNLQNVKTLRTKCIGERTDTRKPPVDLTMASSQTSIPQGAVVAPPPSPMLPNASSLQNMPPPRHLSRPAIPISTVLQNDNAVLHPQTRTVLKRQHSERTRDDPIDQKDSTNRTREQVTGSGDDAYEVKQVVPDAQRPRKRQKTSAPLVRIPNMPSATTTLCDLKPKLEFDIFGRSSAGVNRSLDFDQGSMEVSSIVLERLSEIEAKHKRKPFTPFRDIFRDVKQQVGKVPSLDPTPEVSFHMGSIATRRRYEAQPAVRRKSAVRVLHTRASWDARTLKAQSVRRAQQIVQRVGSWKGEASPFERMADVVDNGLSNGKRSNHSAFAPEGEGTGSAKKRRK